MTTTATVAPDTSTSDGRQKNVGLLFAGLMVTMLLASLNQTVLSTALPTIVGELDGVDHMTWVITSYILASTIVMPVYGRISDLFGRKPVLIVAILLFVAGSVVGGLAQGIGVLIAGRVLQGIGGGGLMILSQAAIADVVPARERGRYMGLMGAVFAVSSVAGPLLGGWLTEGPGWRWAFWLNLPLGALAIAATVAFLHLPKVHTNERPKLDYLGMTLIAGATTALVLVCTWGGGTYEWVSPQIIGLGVGAVILAGLFAFVESRAESPVMPLTLFTNRSFVLTTIAALMIGIAMFGAVGYMPTYIQMVTGADATKAGLLMIPMMGALLVASTFSGQVVSRTGRYKVFPIVGSAIMGIGLILLSTMHADTSTWVMGVYLGVFGFGIGLGMQILTLIVQNAFPARVVGTATASINYFRQVGATVGSAIVGSIFASRLATLIQEKLASVGHAGSAGGQGMKSLTPESVSGLPDAIRLPIVESYNDALLPIFLFMVPLAVIAIIALWFLEEKPLSEQVENEIVAESLAEGELLVTDVAEVNTPALSGTGSRVEDR
ncbi:MDR family MFS transporter [Rhodococcus sp. NPDC058521]|uniref:MDR family MFS transporter n=1 Tax=Rhodococcus sp. NPDC058521 TaxID=3346536 RepID=UPI00365EC00B